MAGPLSTPSDAENCRREIYQADRFSTAKRLVHEKHTWHQGRIDDMITAPAFRVVFK